MGTQKNRLFLAPKTCVHSGIWLITSANLDLWLIKGAMVLTIAGLDHSEVSWSRKAYMTRLAYKVESGILKNHYILSFAEHFYKTRLKAKNYICNLCPAKPGLIVFEITIDPDQLASLEAS